MRYILRRKFSNGRKKADKLNILHFKFFGTGHLSLMGDWF